MAGYDKGSAFKLKLEGADKIKKMLEGLPPEVQKSLARRAGMRAMKPLRRAAQQKLQSYAGKMKNTAKLASMVITYMDTVQKDGSVITGPRRTGRVKFWFAHFIEFGVKGIGRFTGRRKKNNVTVKIIRRRRKKTGELRTEYNVYDKPGSFTVQKGGVDAAFTRTKLIGRVRYRKDQPALPFMRPAYESTKGQIINEYASELRKVVVEYWKKQASDK